MSHLHSILWSKAPERAAAKRLSLLSAGLFQVIRDVFRRYSLWHWADRNPRVMVAAAAGAYARVSMATDTRGKLLDIGCSQKPYLELFAPYVEEYVGLEADGGYGRAAAAGVRGQAVNLPADEPEADLGMAERLGHAVRERVEAAFTWQRTAERCLKAYTDGGRG